MLCIGCCVVIVMCCLLLAGSLCCVFGCCLVVVMCCLLIDDPLSCVLVVVWLWLLVACCSLFRCGVFWLLSGGNV